MKNILTVMKIKHIRKSFLIPIYLGISLALCGLFIYLNPTPTFRAVGDKWQYQEIPGAVGWVKYNQTWYYLDKEGYRLDGWVQIGSDFYYLNWWKGMETGWLKDHDRWYYLGSDGKMLTGFQQLGNNWYWFDSTGVMAKKDIVIDGVKIHFSSDGTITNSEEIKKGEN